MTQAPERIWANSSYKDNHAYGWWRNGPFEAGDEYVRKDTVDKRIAELEYSLKRMTYLQSGGPSNGIESEQWLQDALAVLQKGGG